jgi:superfamily II DNA/RNA helicase
MIEQEETKLLIFLAKQISDDIQSIVNDLAIVTIFSAKKKSDNQETAIANGCDILIATPDRLKEFIDDEKVDLSEIKHVVLDEVETDDDLKKILKHSIKSGKSSKKNLGINLVLCFI